MRIHDNLLLNLTFVALCLRLGSAAEEEMKECKSHKLRTDVLGNITFSAWHSRCSHDTSG